MAVVGWLTERPRWRPLRSQTGRESSPPRFSQPQEPSRSVSVRDRSTPLLHLSRPFAGPARLPRERQAPQSRSSSPRLGSPRSWTRGSLWAALRSAVKRLSSPGSVSAASWRWPIGCLRLAATSSRGSTAAVVSAVANAVGSFAGLGLRPLGASLTVESYPKRFDLPISSGFRQNK